MTIKSLRIAGALSLFMFAGIAAAKSYQVTLDSVATAGTNELKAGQYEVKLEGSQVVFTDEDRGKSISVPVTVEHGAKKFSDTVLESTNKDGKVTIEAITLGGSDTRVVLAH